jgi:microcystin-dependent protein
MSDPFLAEIRIVGFNFAPLGWAFCDGQILPLSQNTALFALLGTTYGGNGQSTFALPNLQGNVPLHPGQGQGLSQRFLGEEGGSATITLLESEIPAHSHTVLTANAAGDINLPSGLAMARSTGGSVYGTTGGTTQLAPQALTPAGGDLPHNNMMRYLTLNFIIALQGIFPPRQ